MDVVYPLMPKEQSREVRCAIRKVFVEVWDPIGVMSDPEWPRDEYDGYIGRVFELLVLGGSDEEICEYLVWASNVNMGLSGTIDMLPPVIQALRQIDLKGEKDAGGSS
jgi:hypothetical protein